MKQVMVVDSVEIDEFISENVLTVNEVCELLEVSRTRVHSMIKKGKLKPVKKSNTTMLFLKETVLERKAEQVELRKKYNPNK